MTDRNLFDDLLQFKPLFKRDKDIFGASYIPEKLLHREKQIDQIASILVTALRGGKPSNVLIFGKTGTGKTAVMNYLGHEIEKKTGSDLSKVHYIYMNCEVVDTHYGVLANIGNHFITDWDSRIPFTGWPTEKVYKQLTDAMDKVGGISVIVLDEIDKLVYKTGDDVLYHLTKINEDLKTAKVSVVGISNDLKFTEYLDPRVQARLGEEKMVFPPYNAEQLQDILKQRADLAFEVGSLDPSVIPLCAALAAQEYGDARRALDLLRVSAELAERDRAQIVTDVYVHKAKNKIELDCVTEVVRTLPQQSKLMLLGIIIETEAGNGVLTTGEVYDIYKELCKKAGMSVLTQRRITDLISELDMLGIINARIIYKGRGGRTREIQLSVPSLETRRVLEEDEVLHEMSDFKPSTRQFKLA